MTRPIDVQLGGLLGEALEASRRGRLSRFIVDETSPALRIFAPEHAALNTEGDWYGEHAGKRDMKWYADRIQLIPYGK